MLTRPREGAILFIYRRTSATPRRKGGANIPGTGWKVDRREVGRYRFVKKCKDKIITCFPVWICYSYYMARGYGSARQTPPLRVIPQMRKILTCKCKSLSFAFTFLNENHSQMRTIIIRISVIFKVNFKFCFCTFTFVKAKKL